MSGSALAAFANQRSGSIVTRPAAAMRRVLVVGERSMSGVCAPFGSQVGFVVVMRMRKAIAIGARIAVSIVSPMSEVAFVCFRMRP